MHFQVRYNHLHANIKRAHDEWALIIRRIGYTDRSLPVYTSCLPELKIHESDQIFLLINGLGQTERTHGIKPDHIYPSNVSTGRLAFPL